MSASMHRVGTSHDRPYTPAGEKHLPQSSIEGLIPCIHHGPIKTGTIFVRPGHVRYQIEKYRKLNEGFKIPKSYNLDEEEPVSAQSDQEPAQYTPVPRPPRKSSSRPVICLNTGRFFDSVNQVSKFYKISTQLLNYHLKGKGKFCKGRQLRFATLQEIQQADLDTNWKYTGELFPLPNEKKTSDFHDLLPD